MKKWLLLMCISSLAACADAERTALLRDTALNTIRDANAAGIDPIQLEPMRLLQLSFACNTAINLVTVINPAVASATQTDIDFCAVVTRAAAPAPIPVARPSNPEGPGPGPVR